MRATILNNISNVVRPFIKKFIERGIELYGKEFAVYNVHNLIYAPDDYAPYGSLDEYSYFKYESLLGRIKTFISLEQVINKYLNLLKTSQFPCGNVQPLGDEVAEYYEEPVLRKPIFDYFDQNSFQSEYEHFREMRFKNFTFRVDNQRDCHCFVANKHYLHIAEILLEIRAGNIFIAGKYY